MEKVLIGAVAGGLAIYGLYYFMTQNKNNGEFLKTEKFDVLKFSDVIKLSKELTKDTGIPQNQKLVLLKIEKDYIITFYDEAKSEIVEGKSIKLECNDIDESLRLTFGDKEMLIIEE